MEGSFYSFLEDNIVLIAVFSVVVCIFYGYRTLFSSGAYGDLLSARHVRLPPRTLITDPRARNAVLKQRFKPQHVPENLDAIVIGSGIGGLTTAVLLGRAGQKVLVLEKHDQAGGTCHTFIDKGYEFDTGIHYVGQMAEGDELRILLDQITEGQVSWNLLDKDYDRIVVPAGEKFKRYDMKAGTRQEFLENLVIQFPEDREALHNWMDLIEDTHQHYVRLLMLKMLPLPLVKVLVKTRIFQMIFGRFMAVINRTIKDALDDLTDNEELKNVLTYFGYLDLGLRPSELILPGYEWLINHAHRGCYYPYGGPSEIPFRIIPIIEKYGGRVLVDAPITKILVDSKGKANGVTVHKSSGDVNIYAKRIITDAGVTNTFRSMLPREIAQKCPIYSIIDKVGQSLSYFTVFIGLNGTSEELGLHAGNTFAFSGADFDKVVCEYLSLTPEKVVDTDAPVMFISFPSAKDPKAWAQKYPGKSSCLIIGLAQWSWFSQWENARVMHRGDQYNTLKARVGKRMWERVEQIYPKLKGKLEYIDYGTPVSNKHYLGMPHGELYGLKNDKSRFQPEFCMHLRPESGVPGLYLTGSDMVHVGFGPCLVSGFITASAILNRNLLQDAVKLEKELKSTSRKKNA